MASTSGAPGEDAERSGPRGLERAAPVVFVLVLALLASIVLRGLGSAPGDASSDDGYYLRYMQRVESQGLGAFPRLFEQWNGDPGHRNFPPPSRIGFVAASALWAEVFGADYHSLRTLSVAAYLALVVLSYVFARRHLGEPRALFVGVLTGFSPLLMGNSRLALTDSVNALCMTTVVWLFLELLGDPGRLRRRIAFMVALTAMVLVKEMSVLLVVPLAAFVLYERFVRGIPHDLLRFALCFAIPGLVAAPLFVLAAGGVAPLLETTRIVLSSPATNPYAIQFGSGPWFRTIVDFLLVSPWPVLLALAWLFAWVLRSSRGEHERTSVLLAFVAALFVFELGFFTKNIRYAVVLELPIRVFAVLWLWAFAARWRPPVRAGATAAAVLLLCWLDWRTFELVWVKSRAYDPFTYFLVVVRALVPAPGG